MYFNQHFVIEKKEEKKECLKSLCLVEWRKENEILTITDAISNVGDTNIDDYTREWIWHFLGEKENGL
jgi:hypothetical protein